ncbi:nucleoid-associated protein YgaU [Inhella inkyongensis]|uniref:Nucleoid-associated protein YgaU n=1 Tax=Inhella inkyongensis TaxID=392593 RepID=A0A840SD62_9BURK|nr:LysM peptidoglycan-binding domain-containing protein [Inhella inkyongensis]MBB5206239.1 nucleoid-associated protein YgaU [Inhella inkyongensis]
MRNAFSPLSLTLLATAALLAVAPVHATNFPVTDAQRGTAERVAQAGVPLEALAPDAPDSYTVKSGDTLWAISTLFLKSPWRWPELWGMNKEQIANPHLIYPGQTLFLIKKDGRATLQMARPAGADSDAQGRLSPRVRASNLADNPVAAIPQHLIEPFLNEAIVLDEDELAQAPRIVAAQEGRVMVSQGENGYVRGIKQAYDHYRVFRTAKPLMNPGTREVLGYESVYLGSAELTRQGEPAREGRAEVPATITVRQMRQEIGVGDRLAPVPPRSFSRYIPHAPEKAIEGRIVSVYGDAITAGQNQIVALNKGQQDGLERGHVLALWRAGKPVTDRTSGRPEAIQLPDEQHGVLFVFQTFKRVSYALIISVKDPVSPGDRFSQP